MINNNTAPTGAEHSDAALSVHLTVSPAFICGVGDAPYVIRKPLLGYGWHWSPASEAEASEWGARHGWDCVAAVL